MKDYYIFKSGRLSRKDNSIIFDTEDQKHTIPIQTISSINLMGEVDLNSAVVHFLMQNNIIVNFFNYYGWYSGSICPREKLLSGHLHVKQAEHYIDTDKRIFLAKSFVQGAIHGMLYNLKRYKEKLQNQNIFLSVEHFSTKLNQTKEIASIMGIEGNIKDLYYSAFPQIIIQPIEFLKRVKHPPDNMINALISFVNSLIYTQILKELYHTQLNATISYLHEPSYRRFSLALDIAEIFKPIYGDRLIFDLLNTNQITHKHFEKELAYCYLKEEGRKIVIKHFDEKLKTTIFHRTLRRKVSYMQIIRLEAYKVIKHILGEKVYEPFKIWW